MYLKYQPQTYLSIIPFSPTYLLPTNLFLTYVHTYLLPTYCQPLPTIGTYYQFLQPTYYLDWWSNTLNHKNQRL
jgi:hypothetical protein